MTVLQFLLPHSQIAGQPAPLKTYCGHTQMSASQIDVVVRDFGRGLADFYESAGSDALCFSVTKL